MNKSSAKKYMTCFLTATALACVAGLLASYILDPFQIFHPSYFTKDKYVVSAERFQNAGIINRLLPTDECCDTIVIGTSHSQNFLPSQVDKAFKTNGTLQLTIAGSLMSEQGIMHRKATESGEIRRVIWDVHDPSALDQVRQPNDPDILKASPEKFLPEYLYDSYKWNDYLLLPSIDMFTRFTSQLRGQPYEKFHSWYDKAKDSFGKGKELGLSELNFVKKEIPKNHAKYKFPNLEEILLPAIKNNPDRQFYILIPPYSRHFYATMTQEKFNELMAMRFFLAHEFEKYKNAKLFAYDDFDFTRDLDNYKDYTHYSEAISNRLLAYMATGTGRLRGENAQDNIRALTKSANHYGSDFMKKYCKSPCPRP